MTDNELRELRELLEERAEQQGLDFHLPPRVWELAGLPDRAIAQLRNDAAGYDKDASRMWNYDKGQYREVNRLEAMSDVLQAEANLIEAKSRLRDLEPNTIERQGVLDDEAT